MDDCERQNLGKLIDEGKTKKIYELINDPKLCLLESKDRITAGDGVKSHNLEGKAEISTSTTVKVFTLLHEAGVQTAYVRPAGSKCFIAKRCDMIPIEWVTRRQATGSFLKRHPGVPEGYRFNPPLQETFYKDDANHDPQWSDQQIISADFKIGPQQRKIGKDEVEIMKRITLVVFEILERAWTARDSSLIDMKIEFGIDMDGQILVADIIDSDSWRLWPSGDKKLMKDKQVYRNLSNVTQQNLETVKQNFKWVEEQLDYIIQAPKPLVVIFMGSSSDAEWCKQIAKSARALGLHPEVRVCSAHKSTLETLNALAEYEGQNVVLIAVAGRSNGLGPVLSGNTVLPVINCPPLNSDNIERSVWSSLDVPSGLGCTTVIYPEAAALAAAQIHAMHNHLVWARLRAKQLDNFLRLKQTDKLEHLLI
ncbi:unnamed protein product [Lasius platythorax]|uniref:PurE domain-containing protein n=1 Tax=Lasius platythorax TaxID=488582 RepID=A0AAV2N669_9HYME